MADWFVVASKPEIPYPTTERRLVLERALVGRTVCDGVFVVPLAGQEVKFTVSIDGAWDGVALTLVEDFVFATGAKERKTWRFTKLADGVYSGTREDVVGAADVRQDGKSVRLSYHALLPAGFGRLKPRFQDVLFFEDDNTIINKAVVSKFGVRLGYVKLTMKRQSALQE